MDFDTWLEEHKDELTPLLRNDQEEALFLAWLAGYNAGTDTMSNFFTKAWSK